MLLKCFVFSSLFLNVYVYGEIVCLLVFHFLRGSYRIFFLRALVEELGGLEGSDLRLFKFPVGCWSAFIRFLFFYFIFKL